MIFSCENNASNNNSSGEGEVIEIGHQIPFVDYDSITKSCFSMESKELLLLIRSIEELNRFKQENAFAVYNEEEWSQFDEAYFASKALVVINEIKTYSGPKYSIYNMVLFDNLMSITILSTDLDNSANTEMSCVFFVIGVWEEDVKEINNLEIKYKY